VLPDNRDAELRTSLEYINEIRRFTAALPVSGDAS